LADFGSAIEKLKEMMATEEGQANIQNIVANFGGGNMDTSNLGSMIGKFAAGNSESDDSSENFAHANGGSENSGGFDPEMMMKMQKMMSMMGGAGGGDNRHASMLNSLKPYLSDGRRGKLDMAAKVMSFAKFAPLMKDL